MCFQYYRLYMCGCMKEEEFTQCSLRNGTNTRCVDDDVEEVEVFRALNECRVHLRDGASARILGEYVTPAPVHPGELQDSKAIKQLADHFSKAAKMKQADKDLLRDPFQEKASTTNKRPQANKDNHHDGRDELKRKPEKAKEAPEITSRNLNTTTSTTSPAVTTNPNTSPPEAPSDNSFLDITELDPTHYHEICTRISHFGHERLKTPRLPSQSEESYNLDTAQQIEAYTYYQLKRAQGLPTTAHDEAFIVFDAKNAASDGRGTDDAGAGAALMAAVDSAHEGADGKKRNQKRNEKKKKKKQQRGMQDQTPAVVLLSEALDDAVLKSYSLE